jgi:hypothetical protein
MILVTGRTSQRGSKEVSAECSRRINAVIFQTGLTEQTPARCEAELRRKK